MKARFIAGIALGLIVAVALTVDGVFGTDTGFTFLVGLMALAAWVEYSSMVLGGGWGIPRVAGGAAVLAFLAAVWVDHHVHGAWLSDADVVLMPGLLVATLGGVHIRGRPLRRP